MAMAHPRRTMISTNSRLPTCLCPLRKKACALLSVKASGISAENTIHTMHSAIVQCRKRVTVP